MKKVIVSTIILSMLLTGCWDMIEPEKLGLVTLIGIDSADSQVRVVIHEMTQQKQSSGSQSESASGSSPIKIHESTGATISDAIQKITASNFRRTYFAHVSAVIVSEELVSSIGMGPITDYFERNPEIRSTVWLLVSKKGQFNRIFNTSTSIEPGVDTGTLIAGIIRNRPTLFFTPNTINDFLTLSWENGSEPYTSGINLIEISAGKAKQHENAKSGDSNKYDLVIENTAVFKNDKLAGWMDNEESAGLSWAAGRIKGGDLTVKLEGKDVILRILKSGSRIKAIIADGKPAVDINVNITSVITESQVNIDYEQMVNVDILQELQAEEIKKQILAAFNKSKDLSSDVFEFGNYFFGKYPQYWKTVQGDWYDHYRNIEINIDVDSKVNHIGLTRKTK